MHKFTEAKPVPSKPCDQCGTLFYKKPYHGQKSWGSKRFCSAKCCVIGTVVSRGKSRKPDSVRLGQTIVDGKKLCPRCERVLGVEHFFRKTSLRSGFDSRCKRCNLLARQSNYAREYAQKKRRPRESWEVYLYMLERTARHAAKRRGYQFLLPDGFVAEQYLRQAGKCHYSGAQMTHQQTRQPTNASLERLDNAIGYVPDNVVLCCVAINYSRGTMSIEEWIDWADRVKKHRAIGAAR